MACWRSGLTHCPLKAAFTGPNPVQATTRKLHDKYRVFLILGPYTGFEPMNQKSLNYLV